MSLINEALKRSDSDKRRNSSPYFDNLTVMRPDDDDEMPPPPRPRSKVSRHEKRPTSRLLIMALVTVVAFGGWYLWSRSTGHIGPQDASAEADKQLTPEQMRAAAERVSPDSTLNKSNTDSLAGAKTDNDVNAKPEDAFTAAMRQLEQARRQAETDEANQPPSPHSEPLTSGGRPIKFRHARPPQGSKPQEVQWPPSAEINTVKPKIPPTAAPAPAPAKTAEPDTDTDAGSTPEPAPKPVAPHEASKLRVTAIMRGPDGNMALINGSLYREGQTIKGATIVKIGQYEVELVADGKRFTIRI